MGEWLIKEKRAKWHSAMPPSSLRVMYGSYYRADKYYKEMELFTNKIGRAITRGVSLFFLYFFQQHWVIKISRNQKSNAFLF